MHTQWQTVKVNMAFNTSFKVRNSILHLVTHIYGNKQQTSTN